VARFQLVYEKYTKNFGYKTTQVDGVCNVLSQQIGINQVIIGSDSSSSTQWMNNINAARNGDGGNGRRRRRNSSKRDRDTAPWNDRELRQEELLGPQLPLQEKQPLRGYPLTLRFSIQYSTRIGIYDISTYNQLFTEYVNSNLNKVVQDLTLLNLPVVNAEAVLLLKDRSPTNKPTSKSPSLSPTVYSTSIPTLGSTSTLPTSLPSDVPLDWDENFNMVTEKVTNNSFVLGLSLGLAGAFMISALGLLWYKKVEKHHNRRGSSDSERSGAFPSSGDRGRRGQRPLSPTQQIVRSLSPQNLMRTLSPHSIGYGLPYFNHPSSTRGDGGSSVSGRSKGTIDLTPVEDTSPTETAEISPEESCSGFVASPRFMTSPRHNSGDVATAIEAAQQQQLHTQTSLSPLQREDIEYLTSPPRRQHSAEKRSSPPRFFSSLAFSSGNGTIHSSSTTTASPGDSPMVGTMSQIERHHLWQQYQLQLQQQARYVDVKNGHEEGRDTEQQQGDRQLHVEVNHPPPPPEAIISPYDTPYAEEMRKKMYELNPSTSLSPTDTEQSDNYKNLFSLNYDSDAGSLSPGPNARRASLASMPSDRHWFSKVESEPSLLPASPQQTPHQTPQQPPRETPNSMPSGGHWYRPPTAEGGSSLQSTPQRSPNWSPQRSPPPSQQQQHHPQANSPQYLGSISRSSMQHRSAMFPLAEYEINNMIHNGSFSSNDDVVSIPEDNRSHHTHHTAESIFDGALDHDSHDELDNYKNQDVEVFRSAIEESVDGVEGMLSLAMTRALTSPDASFELPWAEYVTLQTTNRLPVVDDNKNIIEACCLCETYDWLKRHERSSMDSV